MIRQTTLTNEPTRAVGRAADSIQIHTLPVADGRCRTVGEVPPLPQSVGAGWLAVVVVGFGPTEWCELAHPETTRAMATIRRPFFIVVLTDESARGFRRVHESLTHLILTRGA